MKRETFKILVEKYLQGTASNLEQQELFKCYDALQKNQLNWNEAELGSEETAKHRLYTNILQEIVEQESASPKQPRKLWFKIAAAAAIILVAGAGLFFYNRYANTLRHPGDNVTLGLSKGDIKPGTNKAILTLSDGSTITLNNAANGFIAKQSGVEITKTANGQLIYEVTSSNHPASLASSGRGGKAGEGGEHSSNSSLPSGISPQRGERGVALNTISTPRGGQYQVRLPDGTKVWLNAASKLIYPVSFNGGEKRWVELSGEAYFEVAKVYMTQSPSKGRRMPFIVKSNNQEVQVLGTHFNINSYADEANTKTTLLEGSVRVSSLLSTSSLPSSSLRGGTTKQPQPPPHTSKEVASSLRFPRNDGVKRNDGGVESNNDGTILKPDQQSINDGKNIKVIQVNTELAIAWKNNQFLFESEPIQVIMRKIERWYDVSIEYDGQITDEKFSGGVSRFDNVSKVLKSLESTGKVHFRIEGKKIYVTK